MWKLKHQTEEVRHSIDLEHKMRSVVYGGIGLLVLLGIMALSPATSNSVDAAEPALQSDDSTPSLTVSLQQAIDFNITPTSAGEFGAGVAKIYVSTNNSSGYSISIATNNGKNTLENSNNGIVQPVNDSVTPTNFANNTWGYAFGQGEINASTAIYKALPISMTEVANSTSASANDQYTLALGAKVNTAIPSGQYSNSVTVRVIASPREVTLADISTMQEMTAAICESTSTGASRSLTDTRNGKAYTVFKAKDGNCWMRDNLAVSGTVPKANVAGGTGGNYTLIEDTNYWNENATYGLYYNFDATTAGTGTESGYTNATASICPTGAEVDTNWVLPKTGENRSAYAQAGSFRYLLQQYGITKFYSSISSNATIMTGVNLSFQYGGCVGDNTPCNAGSYGYYWSRTASPRSTMFAEYLYFNTDGYVNPNYNSFNRNYGLSIRCLYPSTSTKADVQAQ